MLGLVMQLTVLPSFFIDPRRGTVDIHAELAHSGLAFGATKQQWQLAKAVFYSSRLRSSSLRPSQTICTPRHNRMKADKRKKITLPASPSGLSNCCA